LSKRIEAILFDFDGTLANTLPLIFHSFKALFKEFKNKEISSEDIVDMFGPTEVGIIHNHFTKDKEKAIRRFYELYKDKHPEFLHKTEEIEDLLKFLKEKDLKLGIVTGKGSQTLEISLDLLDIKNYFDVLISGDDTKIPKPDPEGIFKALDILKISPQKTIFIGDSDADIGAGQKADVYLTIGVNWISDYLQFNLKPDFIFKDVKEFRNLVEKELEMN